MDLRALAQERLARQRSSGSGNPVGSQGTPPHLESASVPASGTLDSSVLTSVVREDFDCALCLKLLLEPVSLSCGHTYCRACLVRALSVNHYCPMCRLPTFASPSDQPQNFLLSKVIPRMFPKEFETRLAEFEEDEADFTTLHVPLFVCEGVPFPGEPVLLNLFEHRYIVMMDKCLEGIRKFGYQEKVADRVGVIIDVLDAGRSQGGTLMMRGVAKSRYEITEGPAELPDTGGLLAATIRSFSDDPIAPSHTADGSGERRTLNSLKDALSATLAALFGQLAPYEVEEIKRRHGDVPLEAEALSYYLSAIIHLDPAMKVTLLHGRSTIDRLQLLYNHLKSQCPPNTAPADDTVTALTAVPARGVLRLYKVSGRSWLATNNALGALLLFVAVAVLMYHFGNLRTDRWSLGVML